MSKVLILPLSSSNEFCEHPAYIAIPMTLSLKKRITELGKACKELNVASCYDPFTNLGEKYINGDQFSKDLAKRLSSGCYYYYITTQKWFDKADEATNSSLKFMYLVVYPDIDFRIEGRQNVKSEVCSLKDIIW